jgi:hypothetical protein
MASARPDSRMTVFRLIFWGGLAGPERRRRRKQTFEPLRCHPKRQVPGPRAGYFSSNRGSS